MQRVSSNISFGFAAMLVHKLDEKYQGSLLKEKRTGGGQCRIFQCGELGISAISAFRADDQ